MNRRIRVFARTSRGGAGLSGCLLLSVVAAGAACGASSSSATRSPPPADAGEADAHRSIDKADAHAGTPDGRAGDARADGGRDGALDAADAPPGCVSPHAVGPHAKSAAWCQVDTVLDQAIAPGTKYLLAGSLPGYAFQAYSLDDAADIVLEYSRADGQLQNAASDTVAAAITTPLLIASASKALSGLAMLHAIDRAAGVADAGVPLTLSTPASILGCKGLTAEARAMTLSELLHQIAGLSQTDDACISQRWSHAHPPTPSALNACACQILANDVAYPPSSFAYGSNNFAVAGAIVEAALQADGMKDSSGALYTYYSWFAQTVADLGLPAGAAGYNTDAQGDWDSDLAGGIITTVPTYAVFLGVLNAMPGLAGRSGAEPLISSALDSAMETPYGSDVTVQFTPFTAFGQSSPDAGTLAFRYGLANWVACTEPWPVQGHWPLGDYSFLSLDYSTCPKKLDHSVGKYGFFPWISTTPGAKTYLGVIGTYDTNAGANTKVDQASFDVQLMLDPLLSSILE